MIESKNEDTAGEKISKGLDKIHTFFVVLFIIMVVVFVLFCPTAKYETDDKLILVNQVFKNTCVVDYKQEEDLSYKIKKITRCSYFRVIEEDKTYYVIPHDGFMSAYTKVKRGDFVFTGDGGKFGFFSCLKVYFFGGTTLEA